MIILKEILKLGLLYLRSGCNKLKKDDDDFNTGSAHYPNSGGVVNYGEEKGAHVEITQHVGLLESTGSQDSGASEARRFSWPWLTTAILGFKFLTRIGRDKDFLAP